MAEFVGLLMIVLALGIGCWRFFKGRKLPGSGLALLVLACFIGVALVLNKRVSELSFGKLATLKAAVTQAQSDADQIAAVRQRVEAQAATIDLVAKESADAKRLLGELRNENAIADKKLRALEGKTSDLGQLPDGRIMTGGFVLGRASVLIDGVTNLVALFSKGKPKEAFDIARDCVRRYEESAAMTKGMQASVGDVVLSKDGVSMMYEAGAKSALMVNENEVGLKWARAGVQNDPRPEMNALLAAALIKSGRDDEAQKFIQETISKGGTNAQTFRALLEQQGILRKR
ncbi:MAG: hypothetical protein HY298_25030 [Verrucomicrobia bacterium]|nr:hypothetical protein [Verrucomicrobiota bacterium]